MKAGKLELAIQSIAAGVRGMHLHTGQAAQKHAGFQKGILPDS